MDSHRNITREKKIQSKMRKLLFISILLFIGHTSVSRSQELGFDEYLDQVLRYHPVARQADLLAKAGRARLRMARGAFDPVVEAGYDVKEYDDKLYYDRRKAMFKVPTWFGLTLKGGYEVREGVFLNPDETLPQDGLYSAGVSLDLSRGFWMDQRMAALKQAKLLREQTLAERQLQLNQLIENAVRAYNNWSRAYLDLQVYEQYVAASANTLEGVRKRSAVGDLAQIDTLESRVAYENRLLGRSEAAFKLRKAGLELSTYLWIEDETPVELREDVVPELEGDAQTEEILALLSGLPDTLDLADHPKLRALDLKVRSLQVERRQKIGMLLPEVALEYNFLAPEPEFASGFDTAAYKAGLSFKLPLFMRKERGAVQLASAKLEDARMENLNTQVVLRNKIRAAREQKAALEQQVELARSIVRDYERLLEGERRKFSFGESSLFLLISRENAAIQATLSYNELRNALWNAGAELYGLYGMIPEEE